MVLMVRYGQADVPIHSQNLGHSLQWTSYRSVGCGSGPGITLPRYSHARPFDNQRHQYTADQDKVPPI
jgi:hypothetical protein